MMNFQADTFRDKDWTPSADTPFRMYFDETNNIRKLLLSDGKLNIKKAKPFTLGGIALMPGQELTGWDTLRKQMHIQPSTTKLKFEHVAPKDYESALASRKLATYLWWLTDSNFHVHYYVLDVFHWSILDIIESMMLSGPPSVRAAHLQLKNELTFAASVDAANFMKMLNEFNYPDIDRSEVNRFLKCVLAFVKHRCPTNRNGYMKLLKEVLRDAIKMPGLELDFLQDEKRGVLIGDFNVHYRARIAAFKHAQHVLDRERAVEKVFKIHEIRDGERLLDYRFAESEDEIGLQASDVFVGLIGRHFSYVQEHTMQELLAALDRFTPQQRECLDLLRGLITRSDAFCRTLFNAVLPLDTFHKNNAFLYGVMRRQHLTERATP